MVGTRPRSRARWPTWVSTRAVLYGEVLEVGQSLLAMSEDEVEEMLAGVHDGISSGLLALAGGWPAVIGLASLTTTDTPLPADGLELPEQLYEFFADEVYRALEPESRIGLGLLATAPSLDRELAAELLGADRAERVCAEALTVGVLVSAMANVQPNEKFESFTFSPAGVSVYHLGNFGTARTKLHGWELKS